MADEFRIAEAIALPGYVIVIAVLFALKNAPSGTGSAAGQRAHA